MNKLLITILVCSLATFTFSETLMNKTIQHSNPIMKTSNIVIKVMTFNILEGGYPAGPPSYMSGLPAYNLKDRSEKIIKFVKSKGPDILLLQECNHWADKKNKRLEHYSKSLDMPYIAIAPNHGAYNVALLSKYPITDYTYFDDDVYYYWNILTATIKLTPSCSIEVASSHFAWWGMPGYSKMSEVEKKQTYIKQKSTLMTFLKKKLDKNFIIGGDWNHSAGQSPFGQGCVHDEIAKLGYGKNALHRFHPKENPIDNIYVSPTGKLKILNCENFPDANDLSDHLPLMAEISITTDLESKSAPAYLFK